ncbi:oligodendrocyte-myelin glycoprotein-like [Lampris incognitus]|uniref:oligodendrocyte-myelin glycoprotein-like n=1 Tax=Lampris incognitus TaxID=2546036 RepID=UPI0024B57CAB|nr:oligodendrocyte-myelin glycoprotein-like [Lampris incognitus]
MLGLLLVLLLGVHVLAVCPSMCSCSSSHREVDCSWKGLRLLPDGLQHNLHSLNISHNRLHNLDGQLTVYAHLRILDLSHNRLAYLPTGLPRSLWRLYAGANRIRLLDKNDTAYQWNLRLLELSNNKLERVVFINNTLSNLRVLNLNHNRFWTVPTNMPVHLETVDLSHNTLVQVLPDSLDRLPRLTHFYLHSNRFSMLPFGALDRLAGLKVISLGDNPWACHLHSNITYLLSWIQRTPARILGCPCHTQPICGEARPGRTGGWHFASYDQPPLAAGARDLSSIPPESSSTGWWYVSELNTQYTTRESLTTQQHSFATTPVRLTTLPLDTTDNHMIEEDLSTKTKPSAMAHRFPTDSLSIASTIFITDKAVSNNSQYMTDTPPVTETPMMPDVTMATVQFFTSESVSAGTRKTATLRTRSVRRPKQSPPDGAHNSSPALTTSFSLPFIQALWSLTPTRSVP